MSEGSIPRDALLLYHRQGDVIRFKTSMTNHELRELMVGIWSRLEQADRREHIDELSAYEYEPNQWLSDTAGSIARAVAGENAINLTDVARYFTKDLP